jgi:hypothetical protein
MLGRKTLAADLTLTAPTDFTTAQDATGALELGFQVEEAEMLVDLEARLVYSGSAAGQVSFTVFINGAAVAALPAAGLWRTEIVAATAGANQTAYVRATVRLAQGFHTASVRGSASAGNITYEGAAAIPSELVVRRHSHPATLGHGVDSKVQLIQ